MQKGKGKLIGLFTLLLITLMFSVSSAEAAETVNIEGALTGVELPNNETVEMVFSLYDSETSETAFWTQQQVIEINNGKYSTVLRSFPGDAFRDDRYYLGVEVQTQKESICLGRKRLATVIDL